MGKQLGSDREAMGAAFGKSESLESLLESAPIASRLRQQPLPAAKSRALPLLCHCFAIASPLFPYCLPAAQQPLPAAKGRAFPPLPHRIAAPERKTP